MDTQEAGLAAAETCNKLIDEIEDKLYAMMETVEQLDSLISAHRSGNPAEVERALHKLQVLTSA